MRRRLAVVGLAVPLVAFIGALVYLYLFGSSEPTFEAATREFAREYTVVRIRDEPPAAMIAPTEPIESVVLVAVLPDDERHVWAATRELGLLNHVEPDGMALIPVVGAIDNDQLSELVGLVSAYVGVKAMYVAAFAGQPIATLCAGDGLNGGWSGVMVVGSEGAAAFDQCGGARMLWVADSDDRADRMVQWMLEQE